MELFDTRLNADDRPMTAPEVKMALWARLSTPSTLKTSA